MSRRPLFLFGLILLILLGQPLLFDWLHHGNGAAFAKGGGDSDDNDDDSDDGDGDGGSGSDSDDDDDDNSGSGSGDDDDDDDGGNSGSGGSGDDGGDGDNSGSGSGDDDGDDDNSGSNGNSGSSSGSGSGGKAGAGGGNDGGRVFGDDVLRLTYTDGTSERLSKGRYERLDRNGRVVERRRASASDQSRLRSLRETVAQNGTASGLKFVVVVNSRQNAIQVTDNAGWSEVVQQGRYTLTDPNGNVVTRRTATDDDIGRLRNAVGLR